MYGVDLALQTCGILGENGTYFSNTFQGFCAYIYTYVHIHTYTYMCTYTYFLGHTTSTCMAILDRSTAKLISQIEKLFTRAYKKK